MTRLIMIDLVFGVCFEVPAVHLERLRWSGCVVYCPMLAASGLCTSRLSLLSRERILMFLK